MTEAEGKGNLLINPARLLSGEVQTASIKTGSIDRYMRAGELSGYRVYVVAVVGQSYPALIGLRPEFSSEPLTMTATYREIPVAIDSRPVPYGQLGIAIERPEGELSHESFWNAFTSLHR